MIKITSYFSCFYAVFERTKASPQTFIPLQSIRVKPIIERLRALGGTAKLVFYVIQYPLLKLVSLPVYLHIPIVKFQCAALPIGIHLSGDLYITD